MGGDHKCPVCQATFTRPQHVARHMRSHTGDRPYKCQFCGDQFARSDLLSRHINKCHPDLKHQLTTNNANDNGNNNSASSAAGAGTGSSGTRRKGSAAANRATTSKQACDQCVQSSLPCDGANPCAKCLQRKCRCTFVKFHRQTAPVGPGHNSTPNTSAAAQAAAAAAAMSGLPPGVGVPSLVPGNAPLHMTPNYLVNDILLGPPPVPITSADLAGSLPPSFRHQSQHGHHPHHHPQFTFPISTSTTPSSSGSLSVSGSFDDPPTMLSADKAAEFTAKYRAQSDLLNLRGMTASESPPLAHPHGSGNQSWQWTDDVYAGRKMQPPGYDSFALHPAYPDRRPSTADYPSPPGGTSSSSSGGGGGVFHYDTASSTSSSRRDSLSSHGHSSSDLHGPFAHTPRYIPPTSVSPPSNAMGMMHHLPGSLPGARPSTIDMIMRSRPQTAHTPGTGTSTTPGAGGGIEFAFGGSPVPESVMAAAAHGGGGMGGRPMSADQYAYNLDKRLRAGGVSGISAELFGPLPGSGSSHLGQPPLHSQHGHSFHGLQGHHGQMHHMPPGVSGGMGLDPLAGFDGVMGYGSTPPPPSSLPPPSSIPNLAAPAGSSSSSSPSASSASAGSSSRPHTSHITNDRGGSGGAGHSVHGRSLSQSQSLGVQGHSHGHHPYAHPFLYAGQEQQQQGQRVERTKSGGPISHSPDPSARDPSNPEDASTSRTTSSSVPGADLSQLGGTGAGSSFSSAFGLMSLDDPTTERTQPFFHDVGGDTAAVDSPEDGGSDPSRPSTGTGTSTSEEVEMDMRMRMGADADKTPAPGVGGQLGHRTASGDINGYRGAPSSSNLGRSNSARSSGRIASGSSHDADGAAVEGGPNGGLGLMTPRETETRQLKEFWKQYMRTPLTGPLSTNAIGGILASGSALDDRDDPSRGPGADSSSPRPPSSKRPRVNSLPSVKTPTADDWNGPGGYAAYPGSSDSHHGAASYQPSHMHHHQYHQHPHHQHPSHGAPGQYAHPSSYAGGTAARPASQHRAGVADDLRSYEEAVLARKAPMLRMPTGLASGGAKESGGGVLSSASSAASAAARGGALRRARAGTVPYPIGGKGDAPVSTSASSTSSALAQDAARPTFKRMSSTTLEGETRKAARRGGPGQVVEDDEDGDDLGESDDCERGDGGDDAKSPGSGDDSGSGSGRDSRGSAEDGSLFHLDEDASTGGGAGGESGAAVAVGERG